MAGLITAPRLMSIGGGALAELPNMLSRLGLTRPLIVTDPYIAKSGILDRATALLDGATIPWSAFSDTVPDPTTEIITIGVGLLQAGKFYNPPATPPRRSAATARSIAGRLHTCRHKRRHSS